MPRNFSNWLQGYMSLTSASESPNAFHFWTGISTIAGALRRRVWIDEHIFQWVPNFYIVLVAPPGIVAKSTSISIGMDLLAGVKGVVFGPQSGTWQFITKALISAISDFTYRDVDGHEHKSKMSAITCAVGELGTFLKTQDDGLMNFLTDIWDGRKGEWSHGTITSGELKVENPWVNIIACTTPAWLRANFPEAQIGGGLTSRIVFVYGDKKRHLVAYPSDLVKSTDYEATKKKLWMDLCEISTLAGQYILTPEAKKWGREWYARHWNGGRSAHLAGERFEGYVARKHTHFHKLAMILTAAKSSKLVIELEELKAAESIITAIEPDLGRVFESIGLVPEVRRISEIVGFVRSYQFLTAQDLFKLCQPIMSRRDFQESFASACESGMIVPTFDVNTGRKGVRVP